MRTACLSLITVVVLLLSSPFGSSAKRFSAPPQQDPQEKKQEKEEPKVTGEFGSKGNPVRCNGPRGERAYLSRLRCADGKAPAFNRIGSFGKGPYGHILDGYNVKCEDKDAVTVFMDMYHEHVEKEPVPGFTIVNDEP